MTGVVIVTGATGGAVTDGRESRASASTVRGINANTPPTSRTADIPAASQIRSDDFVFAMLDLLLFTIRPFYQFDTIYSACYLKEYEENLPRMALLFGLFPYKSLSDNHLKVALIMVQFDVFFARKH
jgi:hypothetical protein